MSQQTVSIDRMKKYLSYSALMTVLLMSLLTLPSVRGFVPFSTTCNRHQSTVLFSSEERSFYDILGASPKDSHDELRNKYTALARQTHPDAMNGKLTVPGSSSGPPEFTEIAAAWQVLSDPKERLRYDRQLRAEEFTDVLGGLFETTLNTAIPFMGKTAETAMAAAQVTGKKAHEVGTRMGHAKIIMDLQSRKKDCESA